MRAQVAALFRAAVPCIADLPPCGLHPGA
jgi:hypothetical protein